MLKRTTGIAIMVLVLLSMTAKSASAQPEIKGVKSKSTNWSGYIIHTSASAVTNVKGEWTVPTVTCTTLYTTASIWVGIDDGSAGTVEQIGVGTDCWRGSGRYFAWYDMFPAPTFWIDDVTVNPGERMFAEVSYTKGKYILILRNLTTGQAFSATVKGTGRRSTAEWVAEARWGQNGILPFSNVGNVSFSNSHATVKGHTSSINDEAWLYEAITMAYKETGIVKAAPSELSQDGTSFSVAWKSN